MVDDPHGGAICSDAPHGWVLGTSELQKLPAFIQDPATVDLVFQVLLPTVRVPIGGCYLRGVGPHCSVCRRCFWRVSSVPGERRGLCGLTTRHRRGHFEARVVQRWLEGCGSGLRLDGGGVLRDPGLRRLDRGSLSRGAGAPETSRARRRESYPKGAQLRPPKVVQHGCAAPSRRARREH